MKSTVYVSGLNKKSEVFCLSIAFFILLSGLSVHAQRPYIPFQHLSTADGLSHNQVLSVIQDRQGFTWIGTLEGLNRYDGYEFTIYHHDRKDTNSLSDNFVSSIVEDKQGALWLGTGAGLSRYNRATNSFTNYTHDEADENSVSPGLINEVIKDGKGNFWLAFVTGYLDYFDATTKKATHYQIKKNLLDLTALLLEEDGTLWIGTQQGLVLMNADHQIIKTYQHNPADPLSLSNNVVNDIFRDSDGSIWIATNQGLNHYNPERQNFTSYLHSHSDENTLSIDAIKCISQDKNGRLWLGTINGGLNVWDKKRNIFHQYHPDESDSRGINDNSIYSLFRDRHDNMWVGTNSSGINFYDNHTKPFVIYQHVPGLATSLSNNKVSAVAEQPGKGFWVATDGGGISFFDDKTETFKTYLHQPSRTDGLPGNFIVDVLWDDHDQCLWIATWGEGLIRFDPVTTRFKNFRHRAGDATSIASNNLWRIYQDRDKRMVYIGTVGNGFSVYDKRSDAFRNYNTNDGLAEENIVSILKDSKGLVWLGSWGNGLTRMDLEKETIVPLPKGITIKSDESITEDSLGRIWITGNPGIQVYDLNKDDVFTLTSEDGLPETNINGMLDDKRGNFWLSTNKGIVKFNVADKKFNSFTTADGLPDNQFSSRLLRAANGKMYFGSVNGLVVFHPDSIKQNQTRPELIITDLKIFNKTIFAGGKDSILKDHISETKEIWLPYEYNFITLNYIALNNTLSPRNQYAYKLKGFNEDWVYVGHQRSATYTSLEPGEYTFMVKASNNDGIWSDEGTSLIIHVLTPWWATLWFRILVALFVAIVIFSLYQYRIQNVRNQNQKLSLLVKERTNELEDLNKAMAVQNNILQERQDEIEVQNEELKQSKEEISAQWDVLVAQNLNLEEARATIERQNEETKLHNDNLELEVQSRTKELLEYNKQLEQFAFISAHNLRAPVARILGLGNVLDLEKGNSADNKMLYKNMVATAYELDRVVRDLNTILEIRKNNNAFISEIIFEDELALVKLYVQKEIEETRTRILSDFYKVERINTVKPYFESILQNLLSNAIKYRHPNRTPIVKISTASIGDYICLTVTDNGLGIDTELNKDKIFKLYQRFHSHVEGKGLGLYLIKTQIDALGGKIELESQLGEGATFKLYFKA